MIKFENTEVMNFEAAFRGMRNPLNSWDKSDSKFDVESSPSKMWLGANDLDLAQRLIKSGSDHRKFLRQIFVSVDITAPLYWWKEFDTYKVGTVANSCSTMHTIHKKPFSLDDFSVEHLAGGSLIAINRFIDLLNIARDAYINYEAYNENDPDGWVEGITCKKDVWWQMIQLLPSSYNQKRTITLTYENLRNIRHSRRGHKLDEWSVGFMEWIDSLPYAEELIDYEN